jgi:hypothetical protein
VGNAKTCQVINKSAVFLCHSFLYSGKEINTKDKKSCQGKPVPFLAHYTHGLGMECFFFLGIFVFLLAERKAKKN